MSVEPLHVIRWEFDRGGVTAQAVCRAPEGADCRLTAVSCECERWGEIRRTTDATWHRIVDGSDTEPQWHEVKPMDDCNICLFINESGYVEELGHGDFVIAETPIRPLWMDDGCDWEPAWECRIPPAQQRLASPRCHCGKYAVDPDHCLTLFDRDDTAVERHAVGACERGV